MKIFFLIGSMRIFIKTLPGRMITIQVNDLDTIEYVKAKIQDRLSVPIDNQRLIYGTQQLDSNKTLSDYGVERNATIVLLVILLGGPGQYNGIVATVFI